MVDNMNMSDPAAPVDPAPSGGIRGFLSTTAGKLIVGGALLLLILGAVAAVLLPSLLDGDGSTDGNGAVPPAGSVPSTSTPGGLASEDATPTLRRAKPLSTVFVFRDIFEPTAKPVVEGAEGGSPSSTSTAGGSGGTTDTADIPDLPPNTLFVRSVDIVDGEPVATFYWNGQTYTAGEGETLEGTPWRVLSISGNTVVLLYGDSRVTLTVGQGLSK